MLLNKDKISQWIFVSYLLFYVLVVILDFAFIGLISYFITPAIFHYLFFLFFLFFLYYIRPFDFKIRTLDVIQHGFSKLLIGLNNFIGRVSDKFKFLNYFLQKKRKFILLITIIFWIFALLSH